MLKFALVCAIERLKPTEAPSIEIDGARDFDEEAKD